MSANPNPQAMIPDDGGLLAAYEAPTITIEMDANGSIAGQTFQLNIRDQAGTLLLSKTPATITDAGSSTTKGEIEFTLTSTQTGVTLGPGDFKFDVWRTDAGFERRVAYGPFPLDKEQWQ